jgi:HPt (histidine-containing phosphotransfer) domain-containing protein
MPARTPRQGQDIVVRVDLDVADLLPGFVANCVRHASELRHALRGADWSAAHAIAHSLHGAGGGYGLDEVSRLGREMETAAQLCDAVKLGGLAGELEDYLARVRPVFE